MSVHATAKISLTVPSSSYHSQFVEISGHLVDLRVVVILDLLEEPGITRQHKVDGCSFPSEATGTADSVDIVLLLLRQFEVYDEADLLNIDAASKHVCRNQDTNGTRSELLHHNFSLLLVHLTVHAGDDEVLLSHAALELVDSALRVAIDDGLVDVQVWVEVQQNVHLPLLLLDGYVVLMDTLKGQVLLLHEDLGWVPHEVLGQAQDVRR